MFGLAFRPFFLGAASFAMLAVALWAAAYLGWLGGFAPRGGWFAWHLHEMPFGFAVAVVAGFLLTAVRNWTDSPGLSGPPLVALFALWLAARIGWLWPAAPWPLLAVVELLFLPLVAARLGWQLAGRGQARNQPLVGLLALLAAADAVSVYNEECDTQYGRPGRRAMCSYFVHIADTPEEDRQGREALIRYFHDALIAAFPGDPDKAPPTYKYFVEICNILRDMKPESLTNKSVLIGSTEQIIEDLKLVEEAGISEVILYFNYGLKSHSLVKEQMQRFMQEVAPAFDGAHRLLGAAE